MLRLPIKATNNQINYCLENTVIRIISKINKIVAAMEVGAMANSKTFNSKGRTVGVENRLGLIMIIDQHLIQIEIKRDMDRKKIEEISREFE